MRWWLVGLLLASLALLGCALLEGLWGWLPARPTDPVATATPTATLRPPRTPTATPTMTPIPTATPTPTPTPTLDPGPCRLAAEEDVTVYQRPSFDAAVFGTLREGMALSPEARAPDGWLGFDPGIAQAANIGVFRLRWIHESAAVGITGACHTLPLVWAPAPGVCYTMPMAEVDVYAAPDAEAAVVATLGVGDYAAVTALDDDFARVDLDQGNTDLDLEGWVPVDTLNLNGPCDDLPTP